MNTPWHSKSVGRSCKGMSLRVEIGVLGTSKKRPRERGVSTRRERSVVGMEKGEKGVESAQMLEIKCRSDLICTSFGVEIWDQLILFRKSYLVKIWATIQVS